MSISTLLARIDPAGHALLARDRDVYQDRELAGQICRGCLTGMDIDGAAISLLTSTSAHTTLHATDTTADLLEDLQFSLGEGACVQAADTAARLRSHAYATDRLLPDVAADVVTRHLAFTPDLQR